MLRPQFRIVSLNLLSDLSRWKERSPLLVKGLAEIDPDLIALQEVNLQANTAYWLAGKLEFEHIYLSPKTGVEAQTEGIAILSRFPFERRETLDLKTQNRVAQCVQVSLDGRRTVVANGHFFWRLGESAERLRQVERFLEWLAGITGSLPVIVCGDFNSTPETSAIRRMKQQFTSAYAARHGQEPGCTTPTPLPHSWRSLLSTLVRYRREIVLRELFKGRSRTYDYIFVNSRVRVLDCQIVLDQPAPDNPKIYPSDHYGLFAELEIMEVLDTELTDAADQHEIFIREG